MSFLGKTSRHDVPEELRSHWTIPAATVTATTTIDALTCLENKKCPESAIQF